MSIAGFDGPSEFMVGAVYGVRSFDLYSGQLAPVTSRIALFRSGVNTKLCIQLGGHCQAITSASGKTVTIRVDTHSMADCSCGFYAYWSYPNHKAYDTVEGIVKGYGEVVLGPHGFRAEKVEVVAVCNTPGAVLRTTRRVPLSRIGFRLPIRTMAMVVGGWLCCLTLMVLSAERHRLGPALIWSLLACGWLIATTPGLLVRGCCTRPNSFLHRIFCRCDLFDWGGGKFHGPETINALKKVYPDLQIYDSLREMMAAYKDQLKTSKDTAVEHIRNEM